ADRVKSEFIENVSHEFRTPLTPIKGFTEMLLMGAAGDLTDMQGTFVGTIKENVDRLTVLVNDVLNIAKLDRETLRLTMRQVELRLLIPEITETVHARGNNSEKNIDLSVNIPDETPMIRADSEKLHQIISNLLDNAFNYTPAGGSIDVTVEQEPDGRSVLIIVSDTGVGIPQDFHEAAWRRFERYDDHALKLDVAGTGLGLPLVRELVLLHNGETWLESEVNKGTSVFVRLPVEQPNYSTETIEMLQIETNRPAGD
ncbi:MAG: sensor histidine kinase, partial [Aggregatilineales bacterium]